MKSLRSRVRWREGFATGAALALAVAAFASCSDDPAPVTQPAPQEDATATPDVVAADASDVAPAPLAKCRGDETRCIRGKVRAVGFSSELAGATVGAWPWFPYGRVRLITFADLAADGTFALTEIPAGEHVYLTITTPTFTGGATSQRMMWMLGPLRVPVAAAPLDIEVSPIFAQIAQVGAADAGTMSWALALLETKAGGASDPGATVSLDLGGRSVPMPYELTSFGFPAYYASLRGDGGTPPQSAVTVRATGGTLSAPTDAPVRFTTPTCVPEITSPAPGATVPVSQALAVEWKKDERCDYSYVELTDDAGTIIDTVTGLGPSDTKSTLPATAFAAAGARRVRLHMVTANCTTKGCGFHGVYDERPITVQ